MKRSNLLFIFFLSLFSSITFASIERCRLDSILGAVRTLQGESSKTLGKVCTILEKVCDLQSTLSLNITVTGLEEILEKVCTIEDTTSLTLEKVCNIQITDSLILEKVCDIQQSLSLIETPTQLDIVLEKVCDILSTETQILFKVCDIQNTDSQILAKVCDIRQSLSLIETSTQIILEKVCDIQTTTTETLTKVCTILDTDTQILQKVCDIQASLSLIGTNTIIPIILDKVCTILDTDTQILEKLCSLPLTVSTLACEPIPIFSAQTISVPGVYCLANSVVGQMTIASSDVDLDLNRHRISGGTNGVVVNSGLTRVTIRNGIIGPVTEDGISVSANASDIMIEKIKTINCGIRGINLDHVNNSSIEKCDLSKSTTGLNLDQSYKICVNKCRALSNALVGYSLLRSTTNTFKDCEALSTGQGATGDATNVFGFRSFSGFGNIFERCIANSTQALTTTVQQGIAAGFMLTGTEVCTKIINCEAANATTSPDGLAIPYGILLQSRFDSLVTNTSIDLFAEPIRSVKWSPDGKFVALANAFTAGGLFPSSVRVFQFNGVGLVQVAATLFSVADTRVFSVDWSPDGKFLAVGGNPDALEVSNTRVFQFNGAGLDEIASALLTGTQTTIFSVDWSPDGKFLAVAGTAGSIDVFYSNLLGPTPATVNTSIRSLPAPGAVVNSIDWSPDGKFLAMGGAAGTGGFDTRVYQFNGVTLDLVASATHGTGVLSVNWSPDGKFLATGGVSAGLVNTRVYQFNGVDSLDQVATVTGVGAVVNSVDWSPDGKFLATGGSIGAGGVTTRVFQFTQTGLIEISTASTPSAVPAASVSSVNWSPDGSYLAVGVPVQTVDIESPLFIFNALEFPCKNFIKNNIVYCNSGNECPAGIGLSGSSLKNCIVGNTGYENVRNFEFVTNIINEEFNTSSVSPTGIAALLNVSCNELNLEANE